MESSVKILVAEDNVANATLIEAVLKSAGFAVTLADDGEQAVELAASEPFDLILMDLGLPKLSGLDASKQIRCLSGPAGTVPIFALTAIADLSVAECEEAGMNGRLQKPISCSDVITTILGAVSAERREAIAS